MDVRHHFGGAAAEDDGRFARVKPGTVLGHANRVLAPFGRRLGPDPASTDIATVGGVIANNSGGMRCGVVADSYSTVRSLTFVLPSGTTIDTAEPDAAERFAAAEPELAAGLAEIRDDIRADPELSERIRAKFRIKNTTGYRLCAFLDADEPVEIFRRLLVGSEGTLAFIAEAVFETVPVPARTMVSWLHFDGFETAVAPVPDFVAAGATAVELMVAPVADRGEPLDTRNPGGVARAPGRVGGAAGGVRRRRRRRARRPRGAGGRGACRAHADQGGRLDPRPRARSSSPGRFARACTG